MSSSVNLERELIDRTDPAPPAENYHPRSSVLALPPRVPRQVLVFSCLVGCLPPTLAWHATRDATACGLLLGYVVLNVFSAMVAVRLAEGTPPTGEEEAGEEELRPSTSGVGPADSGFSAGGLLRHLRSVYVRKWVVGMSVYFLLARYRSLLLWKNPALVAFFTAKPENFFSRAFLFGSFLLWECSNVSLMFGSTTKKWGITSWDRALVAAVMPCQVRFSSLQMNSLVEENGIAPVRAAPQSYFRLQSSLRRLAHIAGCFGIVLVLFSLLKVRLHPILGGGRPFLWLVEGPPFATLVEAEVLAVFVSCGTVFLFDTVPALLQIILDAMRVSTPELVMPFGCVYPLSSGSGSGIFGGTTTANNANFSRYYPLSFSNYCSRAFWSRFARPGVELTRQTWFYFLGGRKRLWLAIPTSFFFAARANHRELGAVLRMKDEKASSENEATAWNLVFLILGCAALLEVWFVSNGDSHTNSGEHAHVDHAVLPDAEADAEESGRGVVMQFPSSSWDGAGQRGEFVGGRNGASRQAYCVRCGVAILSGGSLRVALYLCVHRCFGFDLVKFFHGQ